MTQQLSREASKLVVQALAGEQVPPPDELARVRKAVLQQAVTMGVTSVAMPVAAKALGGSKLVALMGAAKSSFVGAVAIGMSLGTLALGVGSLITRQHPTNHLEAIQQAAPTVTHGRTPDQRQVSRAEPRIDEGLTAAAIAALANPVLSVAPKPIRGMSKEVALPTRASTTKPLGSSLVSVRRVASNQPDHEESSDQVDEVKPAATSADTAAHPSVSTAIAQLEEAQRALSRGNTARAQAVLGEMDANGAASLVDERLTLEALAACQAGQRERAEFAVQRLLRRNPSSPLVARVRASCAMQPIH